MLRKACILTSITCYHKLKLGVSGLRKPQFIDSTSMKFLGRSRGANELFPTYFDPRVNHATTVDSWRINGQENLVVTGSGLDIIARATLGRKSAGCKKVTIPGYRIWRGLVRGILFIPIERHYCPVVRWVGTDSIISTPESC